MATRHQNFVPIDEDEVFEIDDEEDTDYSDAEPEALEAPVLDEDLPEEEPPDFQNSSDHLNSDEETEEIFVSKDESIAWSSKFPSVTGRRATANIFTAVPGVKGAAMDTETCLDSWRLFFSADILQMIVEHTNEKLDIIRQNYQRDIDCMPTDQCEMEALFGLLYISGLRNLSHVDIHDLWKSNGLSPDIFRATMRENRFKLLLRALRFDDGETRLERRKADKMAPIRDLLDDFNDKCTKFYASGVNVTIDEMIAAFRGKCSFKQYIPSKPDKYGLKIFAMVDSKTWYTCYTELYVGLQPGTDRVVSNKPYDIVKRVCG